jgi:hypothetical protein
MGIDGGRAALKRWPQRRHCTPLTCSHAHTNNPRPLPPSSLAAMPAHPCYYRENLLPLPNIRASIHLCPKPGCGQRLKVQQTKKGANYLAVCQSTCFLFPPFTKFLPFSAINLTATTHSCGIGLQPQCIRQPQPQLFLRLANTRSPLTPLHLTSPLSTAWRPPFNRAPSESITLATAVRSPSVLRIACRLMAPANHLHE